jgi:transcriptional regulator with XRE-family HTH domain
MASMELKARLRQELERRQAANHRYSLRAFARDLGVDHASLSQILRGRRALTFATAERFGGRFGWTAAEVDAAVSADEEARFLTAVGAPAFRADVRWLAIRLALPMDRVQILLQRLLRDGRLSLTTPSHWNLCGES